MLQDKSRRDVLRGTGVAALAAGAAVIPIKGVQAADTDAELLKLWDEWKAQNLLVRDAYLIMEEIEGKVFDTCGPCWDLAKVGIVKPGQYRAIFLSSWHNDNTIKTVPFKTKSNYRERAGQIEDSLRKERDEKRTALERRLGLPAAKRKHDEAHVRRREIEERIAEIPAQGLQGIAVKLALWSKYSDSHDIDEPEGDAIMSICKTVANLTGFDIAAKDAEW